MRHGTAALAATATLALAAATPAAASTHYVVRYGDTLTGIANAHGVSLGRLAHANHRPVFGILPAGEVLVIPGSSRPHTYTVRWGDTLSGIGARFGVGVDALARTNRLSPNGLLLAGSRLRVPSVGGGTAGGLPSRYRVRPGDTLSGIAARYGVGLHRLARRNGLHVNGILLAGITLRVPAGAAGVAPIVTGPWSVTAAISRWCAHYGVDTELARAVSWQESGFQAGVVSSAGAWGPMQVLPSTWRYVERVLIGHSVPHTTDGNVRVGVALLHHLVSTFGGDERLAVAAYYQGERSVRHGRILRSTKHYVANVLALRGRV